MNIKGFRRMLLGEKMPDKNDPKYKERYERDVEAGRRFAKATRIDKAAAKVQGFADMHRRLFLAIVFGFIVSALAWNIYRLTVVYRHQPPAGRPRRYRIPCSGNGTRPCRGAKWGKQKQGNHTVTGDSATATRPVTGKYL